MSSKPADTANPDAVSPVSQNALRSAESSINDDTSDFHPTSIPANPAPAQQIQSHQTEISREEIIRTIFGDVGELINGMLFMF